MMTQTAPETDTPETGRRGTRVDGVDVLGALSPSRAADFKGCALQYRFRTIDRLPEPPSPAAVRGTLVHRVLERVFDVPAAERTPEQALALVPEAWQELLDAWPEAQDMFGADLVLDDWLDSARASVERWFTLEDPTRLEPSAREEYVEALLDSKLLLRGVVDRIDVAPDGAIRVVDYKTGNAPGVGWEAGALFQMRFYALVLWRSRGVVPTLLRLVYLGNAETISYEPDEADLLATERLVEAIWEAIRTARETGVFEPSRGSSCRFCAHQAICPAYGGTAPPMPVREEPASADLADQPADGADVDAGEAVVEHPAR